jgi:hypothetical protein
MRVEVDFNRRPPAVELAEQDVFDSLAVTIRGEGEGGQPAAALGALGRLDIDNESVFFDVEALAALGRPDDPEWRSRFDGMVAYAGRHGWVDGEGRVQAHLD